MSAGIRPVLETGSALESRFDVKVLDRVNFGASVLKAGGTTLCGPPLVARLIDGVRCTEVPDVLKVRL